MVLQFGEIFMIEVKHTQKFARKAISSFALRQFTP